MTTLKSIVLLLGLSLTSQISCTMDFCERTDIPKCEISDHHCVSNVLEPKIREWLVEGHPEHFMDRVEPLEFDLLQVPTEKILYSIHNVSLSGYRSAKLEGARFDLKTGKLRYSFVFNFDFYAEDIINNKGDSILGKEKLHIRLENLRVNADVGLELVKRCSNYHLKINSVESKAVFKEDCAIVKSGLPNPDSEFLKLLPQVVGEAANTKLLQNYRTLNLIYPVTTFLKI